MDTVEWGSSERPAPGTPDRGWRRLVGRTGRGTSLALAGLALAALVAAETLPWATLDLSSNSGGDGDLVTPAAGGYTYGINRLNSVAGFAYHLGWFAVLALVGVVLAGRTSQRRAAVGAAVGALAAQLLVVIGIVSSLRDIFSGSSTVLPSSITVSVRPGAYVAFAAIALALAAVVAAGIPAPVRARLAAAAAPEPTEPDDGAPLDLTVAPATPLDERYFVRPD